MLTQFALFLGLDELGLLRRLAAGMEVSLPKVCPSEPSAQASTYRSLMNELSVVR